MPRYTLTPEEFAAVEKLRAKNARTLGYNEAVDAITQVIDAFQTPHGTEDTDLISRITLKNFVADMKRELPI